MEADGSPVGATGAAGGTARSCRATLVRSWVVCPPGVVVGMVGPRWLDPVTSRCLGAKIRCAIDLPAPKPKPMQTL